VIALGDPDAVDALISAPGSEPIAGLGFEQVVRNAPVAIAVVGVAGRVIPSDRRPRPGLGALAARTPRGGHSLARTRPRREPMAVRADRQPPILVGYDPRSLDRAAVRFGVAAARFTGAPLIVACVCAPTDGDGDAEELAPGAKQALEDLAADLDIAVELRELRGTSAPQALHDAAEGEGAALLVVGSTPRSAVGRVLPGSTAERLMHGAPCSIAVVPHGWEERAKLDPIGVGYTETGEGLEALRAAHALARKAGATLRVITVVKPSSPVFAPTEAARPAREGIDVEDVEGARKLAAERAAREALAAVDGRDVNAEIDALVDDPADALVHVSEHLDLLVCGSRGYGPLRAVLLGGVSRRVVAEAHCPVIVLPRGVKAPLEALTTAPGTIAAT
jgi:nucleotide-binding universal stress UspA family protein